MTYPEKWGFIDSLEKCEGKTIEKAGTIIMEHGCTYSMAWVVKFTDGTRAFFCGGKGSGIMNPTIEGVKECELFKPEEYAQMCKDIKKRYMEQKKQKEAKKYQEYLELKKKYEA